MRQKIPQLLDNYKNNLIEVQGDTKCTFERQEKIWQKLHKRRIK